VVARNKKSVTCNLRTPQGQELVRQLVAQADVVVENFRPGTLEGWNLGYDVLSAINPRLVLIRVSGYGQDGPYADRAGFGAIGEAMGGLRYVTGDPATPPSRTGISIGDSLAGTYAALGGLVALHARQRTGRGQVVDSAIYEAVLAMMESLIPEYTVAGYIRERTGGVLPNVVPSNVYATADGQLMLIAANQDAVFRRLAAAMGREDLAEDARFATHSARGMHHEEIDSLISAWTATLSLDELSETLHGNGVPAGLIYRVPEMLEDPHFKARNDIIELPHREFGTIAMHNVAPRLSLTPGSVRWVGPELGEHNTEIYGGLLGLDEAELAARRVAGVI
jgi:formyl-CoA transferase